MNKYIIDLWFSESNMFKLATLRNLISLKRIQRKELPQKTRKKTRKTLNEEGSGGGVVPLRSSINPHISRTTLALFFRVTPTRPAMRNNTRILHLCRTIRPHARAGYNASRSSIGTHSWVLVIPDTTFYIQVNSLIFRSSLWLFDYFW